MTKFPRPASMGRSIVQLLAFQGWRTAKLRFGLNTSGRHSREDLANLISTRIAWGLAKKERKLLRRFLGTTKAHQGVGPNQMYIRNVLIQLVQCVQSQIEFGFPVKTFGELEPSLPGRRIKR